MKEIVRLRDAALAILEAHGIHAITGYRAKRAPRTMQNVDHDGLRISLSPVYGQLLDIWEGRKVLSVAWDATGRIDVVGFHPGPWQAKL